MAPKTARQARTGIRKRRESLLPLLKRAQETERHLSQESVRLISRRLRISENEIYGVASFYPQFRFRPPGKHHIQVCLGNSCHVGGSPNFMEALKIERSLKSGETTADGKFSLEGVGCLGCCAMAPVVVVDGELHGRLNRVTFMRVIESLEAPEERS